MDVPFKVAPFADASKRFASTSSHAVRAFTPGVRKFPHGLPGFTSPSRKWS